MGRQSVSIRGTGERWERKGGTGERGSMESSAERTSAHRKGHCRAWRPGQAWYGRLTRGKAKDDGVGTNVAGWLSS
jgi:hypothetical protein